jgi:hypothetical protein
LNQLVDISMAVFCCLHAAVPDSRCGNASCTIRG